MVKIFKILFFYAILVKMDILRIVGGGGGGGRGKARKRRQGDSVLPAR